MAEPRILLWDIETTFNVVGVFRLFGEDYISHDKVFQERYIVCAAWKWLGKRGVTAVATTDDPKRYAKDPHDDYHVCKALHDVLSQADVIVAHNGDQYDIKFTEGRMIYHGLSPLPPITKIDTLKAAKNRFLFNSNKLDYLARYLGVGKKIKTENDMWINIVKGGDLAVKAIKRMVRYNKYDVVLLEKVFLKLRPYIVDHVNREMFGGKGCPRCDSKNIQRRGIHRALTREYQRFQCQACGGWFRRQRTSTASTEHRVL